MNSAGVTRVVVRIWQRANRNWRVFQEMRVWESFAKPLNLGLSGTSVIRGYCDSVAPHVSESL